MTIFLWVLLRMRNVLDKSCRENQYTHFMFNYFFFRKSCRFWDSVEEYGGDWGSSNDVTIWRISFACWISNATCTRARAHTHKYVILIASPRQKWLRMCYVIRTLSVLFVVFLFSYISYLRTVAHIESSGGWTVHPFRFASPHRLFHPQRT